MKKINSTTCLWCKLIIYIRTTSINTASLIWKCSKSTPEPENIVNLAPVHCDVLTRQQQQQQPPPPHPKIKGVFLSASDGNVLGSSVRD